jgi:hypothetical protein
VLLHDTEELDDDFGAWSDHDLTLASLLGIVHALERVIEDGGSDHFVGIVVSMRFSSRGNQELEVSAKFQVSLQKPRAGRVPNQGFYSSCRKR